MTHSPVISLVKLEVVWAVGGGDPQARHSFLSAGLETRQAEQDHCPVKNKPFTYLSSDKIVQW